MDRQKFPFTGQIRELAVMQEDGEPAGGGGPRRGRAEDLGRVQGRRG